MQKLIYIADDEHSIRQMTKTFLESEGYTVEAFSNGAELRQAIQKKTPDMIILDVMMPGEDGFSLCTAFRRESNIPIIIVSAKDSPLDRVTGITLGSDDYITKPFLPLELIARVNALFRRAALQNPASEKELSNQYTCGNLELYRMERKVLVGKEEFSVTPAEFEFLLYLIEREDMAVSKEELTECLQECKWMKEEQRMSDDLVKRLRKKLKAKGATARVETVWGYGYRLTAKSI